jgi:casein kinase 1
MDLLGDSLEKKFNQCNRKFSLLTVLMIMEQLVSRIEFIHSKNLLHRDIKPDNFLVGRGKKSNIIYAIDFGLSKKYRDSKSGLHIPYRDGKSLTGTARYASINTHLGVEQSRRDDIEALGYIMVYFLRGSLPWQGMVINDPKKKYDKIKQLKYDIKLEDLCAGLPKECIKFIQYARDMKFEDRPDYSYLRHLLRTAAQKNGLVFDNTKFDWIVKEKEEKEKEEEEKNIDK